MNLVGANTERLAQIRPTRLLVLYIAISIGLVQQRAEANTCLRQTPEQKIEAADAVFRGVVSEVEAQEDIGCVLETGEGLRRMFVDVDAVWKGIVFEDQLVVASEYAEPLAVGAEYYVFAFDGRGFLTENPCATRSVPEASAEYDPVLGPGSAPTPGASPREFPCKPPLRRVSGCSAVTGDLTCMWLVVAVTAPLLLRRPGRGSRPGMHGCKERADGVRRHDP
jgi:hypothetical protein